MADIRIKDLATTASTTASDDFLAVDGTTNGTRKLSAATPSFATSVTVPGVAGPTATDLTLTGGSTGASLVLGQGTSGAITLSPKGTSSVQVSNGSTTGTIILGGGAGNGEIYADGASMILSAYGARPLTIYQNGSEKARFAATTGNLLIGTTTDAASLAGGLVINGSGAGAAASSTTTGALRVTGGVGVSGGIYAGAASVFGGAVTASGNVIISNGNLGVGGAVGSFFDILQGGNDAYVYNRRAGSLILGTNNTTLLTFASTGAATFAGAVTAGGAINLSASGQSNAKQIITNTDSASYSHFNLVSGVSQTATLYQFGSTYATAGRYIQGSAVLETGGAGGLNLATSAATPLRFYTNGDNLRMTIASAGDVSIASSSPSVGSTSGALQVAGGIYAGAASVFGNTLKVGGNIGGANQLVAQFTNTGGNGFVEFGASSSKAAQVLVTGAGWMGFYTNATAGTLGTLAMSLSETQAATFAGAVTVAGTVIHTLSATPASASATGTVGTMSWDANYIYICTATNTWKRVAIATW